MKASRSIDVGARPGWTELLRASEDLHAAEVLLGDPLVPARAVVPPLREFWRSMLATAKFAGLGAGEGLTRETIDSGDPTTWLAKDLPDVDAKARARLRESYASLADEPLDKRALRAHAERARALVAIVEPIVGGQPLQARKRRRKWTGLGVAILLLPTAIYVALNTKIEGEGPWRASYYTDTKLESRPIVIREAEVDHDWQKDAPHEEVPPDKFSVRWDTCMRVDEAGPVVFQVNANDAARVFVDGQAILDAWERDPKTRKRGRGSAEVELEAGVHHLRVEYFESLGLASIKVSASFAGEPPAALPSERLIYPGDELDEDNPCGAVGGQAGDGDDEAGAGAGGSEAAPGDGEADSGEREG